MLPDTTKQKIKVYYTCLWVSIAVLVALIVFSILGIQINRHTQDANQPLTIFGKALLELSYLTVPAVYGVFASIPLLKLNKGKNVGSRFFIAMLPIGIICSLIAWFANGLSHVDCGDYCSPSTPSYALINLTFYIGLAINIILPSLAIYKISKLDGNPHAATAVIKKLVIIILTLGILIGGAIGWSNYRNAHQVQCSDGNYYWNSCKN
ncbi:MAG: hypothetical protein ACXWLH_05200 [Candidatus Saccharimonadales bacterium]